MRRIGLILLAAGLAGFLLASTQKARYERPETTSADAADFVPADRAGDAWETARWILAGIGVMGVVFTLLPGKRPA